MRASSFTAAVVAASLLGMSGAHGEQPRGMRMPAQRPAAATPRLPGLRRRAATAPFPCNSQYGMGDSFSGISDDYAGGQGSGAVSGYGNAACDSDTAILTGYENEVAGGNAEYSVIASGESNLITAKYGFIGNGYQSDVSGDGSFIGGGSYQFSYYNGMTQFGSQISGIDSFIGAGDVNEISGNGSFIGAGDYTYEAGGSSNSGNQIGADDSFIGAGDQNSVAGNEAFLGSGSLNAIRSGATYAFIGSGSRNSAAAPYASILGGFGNGASGSYAVVLGGDANSAAGELSLAGGYHASAGHGGSFVWSDFSSGSTTLKDTAANQFIVRSSGGTKFYSNEAMTSGVSLGAGSGTWANLSDRNAKSGVATVDDASILAKVSALPVTAWSYRSERGVRHLGPMAQDFYSAFGVGEDDRHITSIDEDGVALAAIKALNAKLDRKDGEIAQLRSEQKRKDGEFAALRAEVRRLAGSISAAADRPRR